ncbi:unnamed protein product [Calypogeia fissa]
MVGIGYSGHVDGPAWVRARTLRTLGSSRADTREPGQLADTRPPGQTGQLLGSLAQTSSSGHTWQVGNSERVPLTGSKLFIPNSHQSGSSGSKLFIPNSLQSGRSGSISFCASLSLHCSVRPCCQSRQPRVVSFY